LAEKALSIFKGIEKGGGFLKQLKEGIIQRKIAESAAKEQEKFDCKEIILVGINRQPNTNDAMKNKLEVSPFLKINSRKTLISPILKKRLAASYEKQRIEKEQTT
jgi:methylmalonyl-CoA mutase